MFRSLKQETASKKLLALVAGAAILTACGGSPTSGGSQGGNYPTQEITLVVPYSTGGLTDTTTRALAKPLEENLGVPVLVQNQPGASGAIAMQKFAQAEANGYTLFMMLKGPNVISPIVKSNLGYDRGDIKPLGLVTRTPAALTVSADSRFQSISEFIEAAKKNGPLTVGTAGSNTPTQIMVERLAKQGVPLRPVPFDSNQESLSAVMGGNVDAISINISDPIREQIKAGKVRPLAFGVEERQPYLPEVPTLKETGYEVTYGSSFIGIGVPDGTPPKVADRIKKALKNSLGQEKFVSTVGDAYIPDEFIGPREFDQLIDRLHKAYKPVLKP